jgi:hypothetical protein
MRRSGVCSIVAALVLAGATPTAAELRSEKARPSCPASHAHILLADAEAQIYLRPQSTPVPGPSDPEELVACAAGGQRSYALGPPLAAIGVPQVDEGVTSEALAGPVLAYAKASAARAPGYAFGYVVVRDLRTGRGLHRVPAGSSIPPRVSGADPAAAIVVKRDGAVAWITQAVEDVPLPQAPCPGPDPCAMPELFEAVTHSTIHALDGSGDRLLASGTNIGAGSLALRGGRVRWTQGGTAMSARLD